MGFEDYKSDRLSVEIRKNDKEMMEKARLKREAEEVEKKSKSESKEETKKDED